MARRFHILLLVTFMALHFYEVFTDSVSMLRKPAPNMYPQQVHISLSGMDRIRISWITSFSSPSIVYYGTSPRNYTYRAKGSNNMYRYKMNKSVEIDNVVISPLKSNTLYYYCCGINSSQQFSFKTPQAQFPMKFVVVGDLGLTKWTSATLDHIAKTNHDVLILPGDLSYADYYQPKWDRFGNLVQPLASKRPSMVTQGNHEIEKIIGIHKDKFTSYIARWVMLYQESGSPSNFCYSFEVAGVHVLMLGSYDDFGPNSAQYRWLLADLKKVDWKRTPWLIAVVHAPWYNSNEDHQGEHGSTGMKKAVEDVLFKARVDVVLQVMSMPTNVL